MFIKPAIWHIQLCVGPGGITQTGRRTLGVIPFVPSITIEDVNIVIEINLKFNIIRGVIDCSIRPRRSGCTGRGTLSIFNGI